MTNTQRVRRHLRPIWPLLLLMVALGVSPAPAHAESAPRPPLELADVLRSLASRYPDVLAERETVEAARAEARASRGEFDTNLSVQLRAAPLGYYDPRRFDVVIEQPTPLLGASLYAGYRLARGKIAPYYGEQRTLDRGELRAGMRVPLLQDRSLDARRAGVRVSDAQADAAQELFRELLLDLERAAARAYFAWVGSGQKLRVQEELVALAVERAAQLDALVAQGAVPAIDALDNQRTILERKRQLVSARRALEKAALELSLYVRTETGAPRLVEASELPVELRIPHTPAPPDVEAERRALAERPELAAYGARLRAAEIDRALADTRVAPRLDAFAEMSRDFGSADPLYDPALRPSVVEVGASFSMPLWFRRARGKLEAAEAKLRALRAKAQLAADKVRMEVHDAQSQLAAAVERVQVAQQVVEAALQVTSGERDRFRLGASTVLFVNLREQQAADAQLALVDALAEAQYAVVRTRTVAGESSLVAH